jgi:hypothetical protein
MFPYFAAALPEGTLVWELTEGGGPGVAVNISVNADALYYSRRASSGSGTYGHAWSEFVDALNAAASLNTYAVTFATSDQYGIRATITATNVSPADFTLEPQSDAAGGYFGFSATVHTPPIFSPTKSVGADLQPWGTWFPKAWIVHLDDYVPVARQVATSPLTGDGTAVGVIMDSGATYYWRRWHIAAVAGGRITALKVGIPGFSPSSIASAWATAAGSSLIAANGNTVALDGALGWWAHTCGGARTFAAFDDEDATPAETTGIVRYTIVLGGAPMDMSGWPALAESHVERRATGNALRDVRFAALLLSGR